MISARGRLRSPQRKHPVRLRERARITTAARKPLRFPRFPRKTIRLQTPLRAPRAEKSPTSSKRTKPFRLRRILPLWGTLQRAKATHGRSTTLRATIIPAGAATNRLNFRTCGTKPRMSARIAGMRVPIRQSSWVKTTSRSWE